MVLLGTQYLSDNFLISVDNGSTYETTNLATNPIYKQRIVEELREQFIKEVDCKMFSLNNKVYKFLSISNDTIHLLKL